MTSSRDVIPARRAAYEVLRRTFEHEAWTDRAFPAAAERHGLTGRDRALGQRLAYGSVARRGTTDFVVGELSGRSAESLDPPVIAALRLGLFEILFSASADHAAVGQAVELAKGGMRKGGGRRARAASGLVNAVLRRAAKDREPILAAFTDDTVINASEMHSVPLWLTDKWWNELGPESARSLMAAMNHPTETAARVNTLKTTVVALRAELLDAGEPLRELGDDPDLDPPEALVWDGPLAHGAVLAFKEGKMFAQSRGAQAVVGLLDPKPGERILDLCAGPGIKTTAIAAKLAGEGEIVSVEKDGGRARQIEELCQRAGATNVRVVTADAAVGGFGLEALASEGRPFDRVLADPPCTDLGTLASRPDARWRKDPGDVPGLAKVQRAILDCAHRCLAPGGSLVYSTCTISVQENEEVVADAVETHTGLTLDRTFTTRPDLHGTDGFYAARMVKGDG